MAAARLIGRAEEVSDTATTVRSFVAGATGV